MFFYLTSKGYIDILEEITIFFLPKPSLGLQQTFNPCGNFSDTSKMKGSSCKGSIGHAFTVITGLNNQLMNKAYTLLFLDRFLFYLSLTLDTCVVI